VHPVLGREIVEGKQRLAVFAQALDRLRIFGAEAGHEPIQGRLRVVSRIELQFTGIVFSECVTAQ
jgi:hypothetical protein